MLGPRELIRPENSTGPGSRELAAGRTARNCRLQASAMRSTCLPALLLSVGCALGQAQIPVPTGDVMVRVVDQRGGPVSDYAVLPLHVFPQFPGGYGIVPGHGEKVVEPRKLQGSGVLLRGLPLGTLAMRIDAPGFPRAVSAPFCVAQGTTAEVRVQLTDGGAITGRVLDGKGQAVADAVVATADTGDAEHWAAQQRRLFQSFVPELTTKADTRTDGNGAFTLPRLGLGTYALRIHHAGFCDHVAKGIQVTVGKPLELAPVVLETGAQITGVATIDGRPQACLVSLGAMEGERGLILAEVESDAEGRFTLPRRARPGDYTIGYTPIAEVGRSMVSFSKARGVTLRVGAGQDLVRVVDPAPDQKPKEWR